MIFDEITALTAHILVSFGHPAEMVTRFAHKLLNLSTTVLVVPCQRAIRMMMAETQIIMPSILRDDLNLFVTIELTAHITCSWSIIMRIQ